MLAGRPAGLHHICWVLPFFLRFSGAGESPTLYLLTSGNSSHTIFLNSLWARDLFNVTPFHGQNSDRGTATWGHHFITDVKF